MHNFQKTWRYFFISLLLILPLCLSNKGFAHAHKNLWLVWEVTNPLSRAVIHYDEWQAFLDKNVITNEEDITLVDYEHLKEADRELLQAFIKRMSAIPIHQYNRNEQLAYWLNLYNAITVQIIANHYPANSIEEINISPGLFSIGPWGAKLVTVNKIPLSLEEIQNRIIRPIWNDARVHYALNNGSVGAANLNKQAWQGCIIHAQLNSAALAYINSLRGVQVIEGELIVSKIYDWFAEDFGDTEKDVIAHLKQFARAPLKKRLASIRSIGSYAYNWHLNASSAS